jgi:hypothetical protein
VTVRRPVVVLCVLAAACGAVAAATAKHDVPFSRAEAGCELLPESDAFHQRVDALDVAADSDAVIARILADGGDDLHPDFGSNPRYGIPFEVVGPGRRRVPVRIRAYRDESDRGPQPVPRDARIEGGRRSDGDRHVLVLQRDGADADDDCRLIELYRAFPRRGKRNRWRADQVSVFDLGEELPQRPLGWTSADAAGLPILPGLVRRSEVRSGEIDHAIRITFERTRRAYALPASHWASDECGPNLPPMGMRLRLEAGYPLGGMSEDARVVAEALKRYGAIVADNGSNFYITGASSRTWNDDALGDLKAIPGAAFEVVDTGAPVTSDC